MHEARNRIRHQAGMHVGVMPSRAVHANGRWLNPITVCAMGPAHTTI
ncbi:hypothetical protein BPSOL_1237 [Bifidobacterium pseudolongum]|nr:hypothetical protein BPSOL_1237 [Bifidobacterium pseudolongum]